MASKLLIIGAGGKYRNSDVYSWRRMETENPLIGDYENVIIYLPDLNRDSFETTNAHTEVIRSIRKGVADALRGTTHIHFIVAPPAQFRAFTSYELFPFSIDHDVENGRTFKTKDTSLPYLKKVTGWRVAFKDNPRQFAISDMEYVLVSLARTNHEKNAAFRITFQQPNNGPKGGTVDMLPPLFDNNNPSEESTINELIDCYAPLEQVDLKLPKRYQQITLPGEKDLREEDSTLKQTIMDATDRREAISSDLAEYEQLKGVVAFKGKTLEQCVDHALKKLGIDYAATETNMEDGNLTLAAGLQVPVEIKGHDTKGASEQDLRQVIARLTDDTREETVRGILIVNPFYKLQEAEQASKNAFESSVVQQAKAFRIALLDTRVLLKYASDHLKNETNTLQSVLSTTPGEIPYRTKPPVSKEK